MCLTRYAVNYSHLELNFIGFGDSTGCPYNAQGQKTFKTYRFAKCA